MAASLSLSVIADTAKAQKALTETGKDVEALSNTAGGASAGFGSAMDKIGKAALVAGAAIAALAVGAGVAAFKVGSDFQDAYNTIRVGTGATGDALKALEGDFKATLSQVPASFEDTSLAIADLNTRLGLAGAPLQDLSVQFLNLSKITKSDIATNIADITRVFGDWGITDHAASMDQLFRASQSTGIGIDKLSQTVVSFGAPLRGLGFGFEESIAMLSKWEKEGVNAEIVLGAMKKAYGEFSKEFGEKAPEEFRNFVTELQQAPDAASAAALAIERLGVRNGPDFAAAVQEGRFEYGDLVNQITNGTDTINAAAEDTETLGDKWTKFSNKLKVAVEPIATGVFERIMRTAEDLQPTIEQISTFITTTVVPAFDEFAKVVDETLSPALDNLSMPDIDPAFIENIATFGEVVGQAASILGGAWLEHAERMLSILSGIASVVGEHVIPKFQWLIDNVFAPLIEHLQQNSDHFEALASVASKVGTVIAVLVSIPLALAIGAFVIVGTVIFTTVLVMQTLFAWVWKLIQAWWSFANGVKDALGDAVGWVGTKLGELVGVVSELPGRIGGATAGMWDGIKEAFRNAINWVIDKWNSLSFSLPNIPGTDIGGFTLSTPDIPRLASGGIVTSPTLALVGEAGPEAVVPLDRLGGTTYNISVTTTGLGADSPQIARQIVAAIRGYERLNGRIA